MAAKETVNRAFEGNLSDGLMYERRLFHALFATADQKEGMDAFVARAASFQTDKRDNKPKFLGYNSGLLVV